MVSIYEKYGGFATINRVVMAFYDTMLDSDELGPYFERVEMARLIDHQTKFISSLLGGPASFSDEHLRRAHATLEVTPAHFDELKRLLGDTLREHGFAEADIEIVLTEVEARRGLIIA